MEWPKMPDGSVDWMTVFQAPKIGFLPLMEQANTCEKLRECFLLIIDSLFTRAGDADICATYHETAEELFAGESNERALSGQKIKLRMVMMRVMNDRITRARDHEAIKANEEVAECDSRQADEEPTSALET